MFQCPICSNELRCIRNRGESFFTCLKGHGTLRTKTSLNKALGFKISDLILTQGTESDHSHKKCPSCLKKMTETQIVATPPLQLDQCQKCKLCWFDAGEWGQLKNEIPKLSTKENKQKTTISNKEVVPGMELSLLDKQEYIRRVIYPDIKYNFDTGKKRTSLGVATMAILTLMITFGTLSLSKKYGLTLINEFAFIPTNPFRAYGATFFSSFFAHGSVGHIFGNALFFYIFSPDVEEELGTWNYLFLLFLSHIVGTLAFCWAMGPAAGPLIGASAGISGIVLYHTIKFPHHKITKIYSNILRFRFSVTYFGIFFFLSNLISVFTQSGSRIAFAGHLGGAIVGILFAFFY